MSRIGKIPVPLPAGVTVTTNKDVVTVKGPKGELKQTMKPGVSITVENNEVCLSRADDSREQKALHGLYRALIKNMVVGVTQGYERKLRIVGTGYRVEMKGKNLEITAGYCHPVLVQPLPGVEFEVPKASSREYMEFIVRGTDKQSVMEMAARVRRVRTPDLYMGKGIRYSDETPRKLEGKSFGS